MDPADGYDATIRLRVQNNMKLPQKLLINKFCSLRQSATWAISIRPVDQNGNAGHLSFPAFITGMAFLGANKKNSALSAGFEPTRGDPK